MKIEQFWHADAAGQTHPQKLIGKKFVHLASTNLYEVTGCRLNASTDQWSIEYDRHDVKQRGHFPFNRDMAEFLDGRFIEVL